MTEYVTPQPEPSADALFTVHRLADSALPRAYYVQSTATNNVEDQPPATEQRHGRLPLPAKGRSDIGIPPSPAVRLIPSSTQALARMLTQLPDPEIVFFIHGFNNPQAGVLRQVEQMHQIMAEDLALQKRQNLFLIGYRWPSERMLSVRSSTWAAAPDALRSLIVACGILWLAGVFTNFAYAWSAHLWSIADAVRFLVWSLLFPLVVTIPGGLAILRAVIYFRDGYRAVNYGVPDFVDFLRDLDLQLRAAAPEPATPCVRLSFIAHSMGGLVVTNIVRILSNAFAVTDPNPAQTSASHPPVLNSQIANERSNRTPSDLGPHYRLGRLVLVAPDIPNETLMSSRNNFLKSCLRRFEEAYLFSNEGDEVLHLVSTLANYFSFPSSQHDYGYRLGNIAIRANGVQGTRTYGILNLLQLKALDPLDSSCSTPQQRLELTQQLDALATWVADRLFFDRKSLRMYQERRGYSSSPQLPGLDHEPPEDPLAEMPFHMYFTYFDCTDYHDVQATLTPLSISSSQEPHRDTSETDRGLLTQAARKPILRWWDHVLLLLQYVSHRPYRLNVHGGYFEGRESQRLIIRLASGGLDGLLDAMSLDAVDRRTDGGAAPTNQALKMLSDICAQRGIQVLLSPKHYAIAPVVPDAAKVPLTSIT